jgi:hypothetical protein
MLTGVSSMSLPNSLGTWNIALAQPRVAQSPLLMLAAAMLIGIVAGSLITSHPGRALIVDASIVATIAVLSIWLVRNRTPAVTTLLLVAGFIFAGLALSSFHGREHPDASRGCTRRD